MDPEKRSMSRTASRKGVSGTLIRDLWVGKESGENNKGLADCKHDPGSARRAAGETKWPDGLMIYSWVGGEKRSQMQQYISSLWLERCVRKEKLVVKITCTKKEEDSGRKGAMEETPDTWGLQSPQWGLSRKEQNTPEYPRSNSSTGFQHRNSTWTWISAMVQSSRILQASKPLHLLAEMYFV